MYNTNRSSAGGRIRMPYDFNWSDSDDDDYEFPQAAPAPPQQHAATPPAAACERARALLSEEEAEAEEEADQEGVEVEAEDGPGGVEADEALVLDHDEDDASMSDDVEDGDEVAPEVGADRTDPDPDDELDPLARLPADMPRPGDRIKYRFGATGDGKAYKGTVKEVVWDATEEAWIHTSYYPRYRNEACKGVFRDKLVPERIVRLWRFADIVADKAKKKKKPSEPSAQSTMRKPRTAHQEASRRQAEAAEADKAFLATITYLTTSGKPAAKKALATPPKRLAGDFRGEFRKRSLTISSTTSSGGSGTGSAQSGRNKRKRPEGSMPSNGMATPEVTDEQIALADAHAKAQACDAEVARKKAEAAHAAAAHAAEAAAFLRQRKAMQDAQRMTTIA